MWMAPLAPSRFASICLPHFSLAITITTIIHHAMAPNSIDTSTKSAPLGTSGDSSTRCTTPREATKKAPKLGPKPTLVCANGIVMYL